MADFVISTYLKELQYGMQDTQENTVRSVLGAITDCLKSPPDLLPRTITGIIKRQLDVPMSIKKLRQTLRSLPKPIVILMIILLME